jgi:hypothetical protein
VQQPVKCCAFGQSSNGAEVSFNDDGWLMLPNAHVSVLDQRQLRPRRGFWAWLFRRPVRAVVVSGRVPVLDASQVRPWQEVLEDSVRRVPRGEK